MVILWPVAVERSHFVRPQPHSKDEVISMSLRFDPRALVRRLREPSWSGRRDDGSGNLTGCPPGDLQSHGELPPVSPASEA